MNDLKNENLNQLKKIIEFYSTITEDKEVKNGNLLNFLMDIISDSIWQWNMNIGKLKCSKNLQKTIGDIGEDIDSFLNVVHPDDIEMMKEKMVKFIVSNSGKNIFSDQNIYEYKYRVKSLTGEWIEVMDKAKIISWNDDGSPAVISGIHLNI